MRNQTWLPDGTLVEDWEIYLGPSGYRHINHLTGVDRPATQDEIALLPDPDIARAQELLASSPTVITMPEMWELFRIFGRKLGYHVQ